MNNKTNIEKDIKNINDYIHDWYDNSIDEDGYDKHIIDEDDEIFINSIENILADRARLQIKANKYDSLVKKIEKELEEKEQLRENYWERNTIRLHFIEDNERDKISKEELEINDKHMQLKGEVKALKFYKNY